jgi:predicted aspartyl protease
MKDKRAGVYYVDIHVEGADRANYLVETGAADMTINEDTLSALQADDDATDAKHLQGVLANGKTIIGPGCRIGRIHIGDNCKIYDAEATVFPRMSRSLLGLSALRKTAPFMFSR